MRTTLHDSTAYIRITAVPEKLIHSDYIKQFIMLSKHDRYWNGNLFKLSFGVPRGKGISHINAVYLNKVRPCIDNLTGEIKPYSCTMST